MSIAVIVIVTSIHMLFSLKVNHHPQRKFILHSFGDPNTGWKSNVLREYQKLCRNYEKAIYTDPDINGITHVSPAIWAPWMETVWMGNHYEYRSAYFHDVMYSNNKRRQEGALLFSDPHKSLQMIMLYQRYKRFDDSNYGTSNATLFNVFGAEPLRIGRYKLPQSDEVILCITDPLTTSTMKRYLNSFNALKWFKAKFYQQMRKRQYTMNLRCTQRATATAADLGSRQSKAEPAAHSNILQSLDCSFLLDAIYKIEYGCAAEYLGEARALLPYTVPVLPVELSDEFIVLDDTTTYAVAESAHARITSVTTTCWGSGAEGADTVGCPPETSRIVSDSTASAANAEGEQHAATLVLPIARANKQYVLESLWHTLLQYISRRALEPAERTASTTGTPMFGTGGYLTSIITRSDGSPMSQIAADVLRRVAAGHGVANVQVLPYECTKEDCVAAASNAGFGADIEITCRTEGVENVLKGTFSISVVWRRTGAAATGTGGPSGEVVNRRTSSLQRADWQEVLRGMRECRHVRMVPSRLTA